MIGNLTVGIQDFVIPAPQGDFESIATVTVGSGGATDATFTAIPGTFQHLQIRFIGRSARSATEDSYLIRVNSDTGSNYSWHYLYGDGSAASSGTDNNKTYIQADRLSAATATAGIFGIGVIDILDYANTNKNKTFRILAGVDRNGAGAVNFSSGVWRVSANAITSIEFKAANGNLAEHTQIALYGIKG